MKGINLKWINESKLFKDFDEKVLDVLDTIKPTSTSDIKSLYHGENQYFFLPDFSVYVDKGKDFFKECANDLKEYISGSDGIDYSSLHQNLSSTAKEISEPFLSNYFDSETLDIASNISLDPSTIDYVNLDNITSYFDFFDSGSEIAQSAIETISESEITEYLPEVIANVDGSSLFEKIGNGINNAVESIGEKISKIELEDVLEFLGGLFGG